MGVVDPSIPKSVEEIVELILRVVCIVLCFCIMISAAVTLQAVEDLNANLETINNRYGVDYENDDAGAYEAAAGWLVFVAVMGMVIEILIIIIRILNISFINQAFILFGITDIIISILFVISLLSGGAASAAYASENDDFYANYERTCMGRPADRDDDIENACNDIIRVRDSEGAAAAFSFFGMVTFGALAGIMLYYILFKSRSSTSGKGPSS